MTVRAYPKYRESGAGKLGQVPDHWAVKPVWSVTSCNDDVLDENTPADYKFRYVEISNVDAVLGIVNASVVTFGTAPSRARRRVEDGDVIISTVRTYLRAIASIKNSECNIIVSTGFAVFRSRSINSRFMHYVCQTEFFISDVISRSVGVSYPAINASEIARLHIPVPPVSEQSTIAAFLDDETGKIDALVAEQERLIALLKEKRQAVISHAVTKGLNPDAPMKDSGVPWLGEVPAHWKVKRLKHLIAEGTSISYGIVQPGEPQIAGVPFIQTTNMTSGQFALDGLQRTTPEIASAYPRSRLTGGEVLLGIRASIGAAFMVPSFLRGANLSRGVARIVPGSGIIAPYLVDFFATESVSAYWEQMRQGSTFNEVAIETVRELWVTAPPTSEQENLVEAMRAINTEFAKLSTEATRAIILLRERRAALISAAVTGKIDVRGAVPEAQDAA